MHNERATRSQFTTPGQEVALINSHWGRRIAGKRVIAKVYANGNFVLMDGAGKPDKQQWRPDWNGDQAVRTGEQYYIHEHLELWSAEIEKEFMKQKLQTELRRQIDSIIKYLEHLKQSGDIDPVLIAKIRETISGDKEITNAA